MDQISNGAYGSLETGSSQNNQGATSIFGNPGAYDGAVDAPNTTQPYVLGVNQTGAGSNNTAASNPTDAVDIGEVLVNTAPNQNAGSSGSIDTSSVSGSFQDVYGNSYSSQEAADNGQDEIQDSSDDGSGSSGSNYNGADTGNDYSGSGDTNYAGSYGGSYGGGYDVASSGGSYGGSSGFGPVVLDLTGKGINITPKSSSNMFYDMAGDGYQHHTAWAASGDGVLVLDTSGNGKITQQNQVVFTDWDPTATTDMQALLDVFDTNHDGKLDTGDTQFANFKIMVTNADGTTTLETLAQAGVSSITLKSDKTSQVFVDGSSIDGETTYTKTNGTTGTAATVTFAFDNDGRALRSTTTHNADGSTTIDNQTLNTNGSLASEIKSTVSANGLSKTIVFDSNGDGVIDDAQTDQTVVGANGIKTETLSNANAAGVLLNRTTTTTSADGRTITIARDTDGNGVVNQTEVDVTPTDGSKSVTIIDQNPDASTQDKIVHLTSADGQTGTTKSDQNGDGVYDLTTVDATVTNSDASRTQTVSDTNADGSLRDKTIETTSADALSQTIQSDANGDGVIDLTRVSAIVLNTDGSTTTTQTDKNNDSSLRDSLTTTISANGLVTATKSDLNGDGKVDVSTNDATTVKSDGSRTEKISDMNVQNILLDQTVIVKGADGISRTTSVDADGNGTFDNVDQTVLGSTGIVTVTLSNYDPNGTTLKNRTITTTSADGLTQTIQSDVDGDGQIDRTASVTTAKNSNGSATVTHGDRSANGALLDQTVTTTSANGLSVSSQTDLNGDGTIEHTTSDVTVVNSDGSRTTTASTSSTNGTLQSKVVTAISADRNTTTITGDTNGDGTVDTTEVIARQSNGTVVDTLTALSPTGAVLSTNTDTVSATGLSKTVQADVNGDKTIDETTSDTTVLNKDGSRTETVAVSGASNALRSKTVTTTNATGLSTTRQSDVDGNGTIDLTTSDVTVLNKDGSRTETVKQTGGSTTLNSTVVTTSATGLTRTSVSDANGDGVTDTTTTDATALNTNGTTRETVTQTNNNGSLCDQTVTLTSADRKTVTVTRNIDGDSTTDSSDVVAMQSDGSMVDTFTAMNASSSLIEKEVKTTAANGLSWSQTLDANGDGTIDETQSDSIVVNSDGSRTEIGTDANTNYNVQPGTAGDVTRVVTTTSASGLSKTIVVTGNNDGFDVGHTFSDTTTINADGSTSELRNVTGTDYRNRTYSVDSELITTAAHGVSRTVQLDEYGVGSYNIIDQTVLNADGSTTETYTELDDEGSLYEKDLTTTSANGRNVQLQRDTDGDGNFDEFKTTSYNADGSRTDVNWTTANNGTLLDKTTTLTSADGRVHAILFDTDGDGVIDQTERQSSVVNNDGSTTETRSDLNANGSLRDRIITTTSGNGLAVTGTINLDGDYTVDETFSDLTVLNKDGSRTETVQTLYADGSLKSKTVTSTSANGLNVTTNEDRNGDGRNDVVETAVTASSGVKTVTTSYYDGSGTLLSRDIATVSADGRQQTISRDFNGDGTQDALDIEDFAADGNGSYDLTAEDANYLLYEGNHIFDENNVDQVSVQVSGSGNQYFWTETQLQEAENLGLVDRFYDTILDRDPTAAEQQGYYQYDTSDDLIDAVMASSEFTQKYGSMTDARFVEQIFQNAFGRSARLSELSTFLPELSAKTLRRDDFILDESETAAHLAEDNVHAVTNNSQSTNGTFSLDHTTDKMVAADTVDRLYLTGLDRHASTSESSSNSQAILAGSKTEAQIAGAIIASAEFTTDYGAATDSQFVNAMFENGLHRAPTTQESQTWVQLLGNATISRADFLVAVADSPDHLAVANSSSTSSSSTSSSSTDTSASFNTMVQAMAVAPAQASSSSAAPASVLAPHDVQLAGAHH